MKVIAALALGALAIPCQGQSASNAQVFSGKDLTSQMTALAQAAKTSGSSGATLDDFPSHAIKLSVRTASGGAEIHAHFDDIFVVTQGRATLITGGTIVNAQIGSDGETKGSRIQDGKSQTIAKDDIVHIPAGTPHQLIVTPGDTFGTIVVKVKE